MSFFIAKADSPFEWSAASSEGQIRVSVKVPENYYLYSNLTKVSVIDSAGNALVPVKSPPDKKYVNEFKEEHRIYGSGAHDWVYAPGASPPFNVSIKYQGCSKSPFMCYPPSSKGFELEGGMIREAVNAVVSEGKKIVEIHDAKIAIKGKTNFIEKLVEKGGWRFFLAAFLGGILSVLTPCVLPLIPITMAILAGKDGGGGSSFGKALFYVAGIILTFTVLAALAAFSGRTFGAQILGNSIVITIFSLLFFFLSLSMLGLYELQLPSSVQTKLSVIGGDGKIGAFLMGLAAGFVAVPCTGPVLGTLLAVAAVSGNPVFSVSLLFAYACGFGMPFLLLGSGIGKVPKGGAFMDIVKSALGIAIMTISFYALSISVKPFDEFLSTGLGSAKVISLACVILGFIAGAVHADGHSPKIAVRFAKIAGAALVAFGIVWNLKSEFPTTKENIDGIRWTHSLDDALNEAKKSGGDRKYILLDFGAEWCAACKEMDAVTFTDKTVIDEINRNWIAVKIDGTVSSAGLVALEQKYAVTGYPGFVVLDSKGNQKGNFTGFHAPGDFLDRIKILKE
jgi:thiol:disulfide interchange protein DsbD